ncbi:MAG TPA: hypothetical protein VNT25_00885 [Allosphingosinicella sp.]|nr:hypothetical protein [Allosphingosinicella sp.]
MADMVFELSVEECSFVAGGDGGVLLGSGTRSDTGDGGGITASGG